MQVCIILQQNEVRRQHRNDVQRSLQQAREARGGRASGQDHACEGLIDGLLVLPSFAATIAGPGGHPSTARRGTTARPPRKAATPTRQYPSATLQLPRQRAAVATSMTSSSSGFARRHGVVRGQLCTNAVQRPIHSYRRKARVAYEAMQQTSRRSSASETLHLVASSAEKLGGAEHMHSIYDTVYTCQPEAPRPLANAGSQRHFQKTTMSRTSPFPQGRSRKVAVGQRNSAVRHLP